MRRLRLGTANTDAQILRSAQDDSVKVVSRSFVFFLSCCGLLVSHPFAQNAEGWGTPLLLSGLGVHLECVPPFVSVRRGELVGALLGSSGSTGLAGPVRGENFWGPDATID